MVAIASIILAFYLGYAVFKYSTCLRCKAREEGIFVCGYMAGYKRAQDDGPQDVPDIFMAKEEYLDFLEDEERDDSNGES